MRNKHTVLTSVLALSALLVGLAAPLGAQGFSLDLEETPAAEFSLQVEQMTAAGSLPLTMEQPAVEQVGAALRRHRAASLSGAVGPSAQQDAAEPAGAAMPQKKNKRWYKKYWWVGVLAAGAIALAVDSDDSDAGGEED